MPLVRMDMRRITDWKSFHDEFAHVFGFPSFYGRNMDAWIDCMTSLDAPNDGMSSVHCSPPDVVVLQLDHATHLRRHAPDLLDAIVQCAAFVNSRRIDMGQCAVLALSYWDDSPADADESPS